MLWIKQQLLDYGLNFKNIPIKCDNTSAINLTKNPALLLKQLLRQLKLQKVAHACKKTITSKFNLLK